MKFDIHDIGIFVINLERSKERLENISKWLHREQLPFFRVPAIDGARDPELALSRRNSKYEGGGNAIGVNILSGNPFRLNEEACFCSHLAALDCFMMSNRNFGLILEDDAEPTRLVTQILLSIVNSGVTFDIIRLDAKKISGGCIAFIKKNLGNVALIERFQRRGTAVAYMVSKEGATKLIRNSCKNVAFDQYLNDPSLSRCKDIGVTPSIFRQSGAESTLSSDMTKPTRSKFDIIRRRRRIRRKLFLTFSFLGAWNLRYPFPAYFPWADKPSADA